MIRKPIRVLLLFGRMNRGGAEIRTVELMRCLNRKQFQLDFCSLSGQPGDLDGRIREMGGEIHYLPIYQARFPFRYIRLLRQKGYHVVQSNIYYPSGFLLWLAAIAGVPNRITSFRSSNDGRENSPLRRIRNSVLKYLIERYSTHILAVSASAMAVAWRPDWHSDPRCRVIYNGIDLERFETPNDPMMVCQEFGIPIESRIYIHIGRFTEAKNHLRLLSIFTEIAKQDSKSYLLLVGRGDNDLEADLRRKIANSILEKRVVFTGLRNDIPRLLNSADLMLFPSLWEGLPGAVLEAAAAGVPVLASNLPVIQEVASFLPGVKGMSLNESNEAWAAGANSLREQSSSNKETLRRQFAQSPFTVASSAAAYSDIWLNS